MKLAKKTYRSFLFLVAILLPIASVIIYLALDVLLSKEVDEQLESTSAYYLEQLIDGETPQSVEPIVEIKFLKEKTAETKSFSTIELYDAYEKEDEPYRELISVVEINGKYYELTCRQSVLESEDLMVTILAVVMLILLFFVGAIYLINKRNFKRIWSPFYATLAQLKGFDVAKSDSLMFNETLIDEFTELNEVLHELTVKVKSDYVVLKEFTENASHEIQTPLAIISLNLEELSQENQLSLEGRKNLVACYESARRLSKLNEKLLLLAKIENAQFDQNENVSINELLKELIEIHRQLEPKRADLIQLDIDEILHIEIDPSLAQILISNLLSNALKHGIKDRIITIRITESCFSISNDFAGSIDTSTLFNRFQKQTSKKNSVGLGLAIAKKISAKYLLNLDVQTNNQSITFTLEKFSK